MKHVKSIRPKPEDPDVKIESKSGCPLSILYGLTPFGEEHLKAFGLNKTEITGGYFVDNRELLDIIDELIEKGIEVS